MAHAHPQSRPPIIPRGHARPLPLRVGTRGSPLALWQTRYFLRRLSGLCPVLRDMEVFEEHVIRTTGDATQEANTRLADLGGKGLFAKEIHEALSDRRIDFAVHSLKDLETELPPGIVLACTLVREDARDALILPQGGTVADGIAALPRGALLGSSSLRRQAQLLHLRPDLRFGVLRGNVARRIERVRNGDFGATLLALAPQIVGYLLPGKADSTHLLYYALPGLILFSIRDSASLVLFATNKMKPLLTSCGSISLAASPVR